LWGTLEWVRTKALLHRVALFWGIKRTSAGVSVPPALALVFQASMKFGLPLAEAML